MQRAGWLGVALLTACAPGLRQGGVDAGAGAPDELAATLNVGVQVGAVHVELHVTNATTGTVTLEFATAQRYDVEISDAGGQLVWRWSEDRMFAQATGREVLLAGESLRYAVTWTPAVAGEYHATGRLVSTNYPVELRTSFRIPAD